MKEAPSSPYSNLIFRETFRDEQETRRNGGTPTNVDFSNGVASFNGTNSFIDYPTNVKGTYTIRLIGVFKQDTKAIIDFRLNSGTGYIITSAGAFALSSGTFYVNGSAGNANNYNKLELVVTGISLDSNIIRLCRLFTTSSYLEADIDLVEIYQGTLTASEVKNLYNNTWNKEQSFGGQTGSNIITNGTFDTDVTGWTDTTAGTTTWDNGSALLTLTGTAGGGLQLLDLKVGYKYKVTGRVKNIDATDVKINIINNAQTAFISESNAVTSTAWTDISYEFTATETNSYIYLRVTGNAGAPFETGNVDNVEVREVQPQTLLDFDSTNGVLEDRADNTLTATAVTVNKNGALFNGTTSKIDTGSDMIGTKAVTVMGWIKPYRWGELGGGRIIDNGSLIFHIWDDDNYLYLTSIGTSGGAVSASNSITLNKLQFVCATREADGTTNYYIGDLDSAPALSGSADQASGTPTAGTENVVVGNRDNGERAYDGLINKLTLVEGVLDIDDITRYYTESLKHIK